MVPPLIRALRPHQWSKNVFVLAVLAFALVSDGVTPGPEAVPRTLMAFAAFCLGASAIYLLNDVLDLEADRAHPIKCKRPIAAGELSVPVALGASAVLGVAAFGLARAAGGGGWSVALVMGSYLGLNLAYSLGLKRVVLLDAFCIAIGFVLRVIAGGLTAGVEPSHWILLCTLFLALFLALCKRRAELAMLGEDGAATRATLGKYDRAFLDQMVGVLAACTIVCYTMWATDPGTSERIGSPHMVWTVPFVVFGIGRFLHLVHSGRGGDRPTRIFLGGDVPFLLNLVGWLVTSAALALR
jgi:4-hydroxybenzoate polyprenyltransferase